MIEFSFGKRSIRNQRQPKAEVFPDKLVMSLMPLSRDENDEVVRSAKRKIVFNMLAQTTLELFNNVGSNDEPVFENTEIVHWVQGVDNYIFVVGDNTKVINTQGEEVSIPATILVKKTSMGVNNKSLYDNLVAQYNLDTTQENHLELTIVEQQQVNSDVYSIAPITQEEAVVEPTAEEIVEDIENMSMTEEIELEEATNNSY
jgi:hypothetical protein